MRLVCGRLADMHGHEETPRSMVRKSRQLCPGGVQLPQSSRADILMFGAHVLSAISVLKTASLESAFTALNRSAADRIVSRIGARACVPIRKPDRPPRQRQRDNL